MTAAEWMVGFRDGSVIDHVVVPGETAVAAADAVRAERPGVLIAAVIGWPTPANRCERIEYSDMPPRYREMRRYNGPLGGHHGYMVVWPDQDGSRSSLPNRPISLEQARWYRDWLLSGYFKLLHDSLQRPYFSAPLPPEIVRLEVVTE